MTFATLARGRNAEDRAAKYLQGKGWRILARNYRLRSAELDIIALDGQTLVFVEVKQRSNHGKGFPEEAVDQRKAMKLYRAAEYYLLQHPLKPGQQCRFDVVAIDGADITGALRHTVNALCR